MKKGFTLVSVRPRVAMRNALFKLGQRCLLSLCLLFPLVGTAQQFVDLTVEIESDDWDWLFFNDQNGPKLPNGSSVFAASIFPTNAVFHCVIGTNAWLVEQGDENGKVSYWFTGTNIIEQRVRPMSKPFTEVAASVDGNPGRPVRVSDRMVFNPAGRICWLAFCSGSFLKRDGRQVFPPSDRWKESRLVDSGWSDKTTFTGGRRGVRAGRPVPWATRNGV
jgi:hypothetical protein